jgi:hypothetical protein
MKAAGRPAYYDRSAGGVLHSLLPSAVPEFAFDGGTDTAQEFTAAPADAAPPLSDQADQPETSTVMPEDTDTSAADQTYPVLPLTVVPKPDVRPLVSLKAHDVNQRITMLALVLALLSAVTLLLWRYHRRDYASPRRIGRRI